MDRVFNRALGKVVKQNANVGVAAGVSELDTETVLESMKSRFVDGAVFLRPLKVVDVPPPF